MQENNGTREAPQKCAAANIASSISKEVIIFQSNDLNNDLVDQELELESINRLSKRRDNLCRKPSDFNEYHSGGVINFQPSSTQLDDEIVEFAP